MDPPWRTTQPAPQALISARQTSRGVSLLAAHPATTDALAHLPGCDAPWVTAEPELAGAALLDRYPATAEALEALLARA